MVYFVGAGAGDPELLTIKGKRLIDQADVIIYAGSLVNPAVLQDVKPDCRIYDSAGMTLEEVLAVMEQAEQEGKATVRVHTGDPSLYGAIREQIDALDERGISHAVVPGVSSFLAAATALEKGVHPAGCDSDCDPHPDGRPDIGSGGRANRIPGQASGHDDSILVCGANRRTGAAAVHVISGRYAGCGCV